MTHGDLFTGIGGFTIAAAWAGFRSVFFSEIEPYCSALLGQHWPSVPNLGDIRTADFPIWRGRIDVLSAGVPCQPASLAGKRRGSGDERWLWEATLDVVGVVQPAWCIFENPVGILTLGEFGGVLLRLDTLGYEVRAFSVPANAVGAKHRRQRLFIVAHADRNRGQWAEEVGAGACIEAKGSSQDTEFMADSDRTGLEEHESCDQGELSAALGSCGPHRFRFTQPPLCGRADGISYRSHRLKALGNAVVPQQAYPFFEAIARLSKSL